MDVRIAPPPAPVARPLRVVAVGDSLTAGTQDSTTVENRQEMSYMAQLSRAVGFPFHMACVSEGGIGPRLFQQGEFNYGHARQRDENIRQAVRPLEQQLQHGQIPDDLTAVWNIAGMGRRTDDSLDRPFHRQGNFAVPGYEARHLGGIRHYDEYLMQMRDGVEATGLAGEVPLVRNLLQNGTDETRGSALDQAVDRQPDLTVVWAGNNDALETVGHGRVDDRLLTPIEDRVWTYLERDPANGQWVQKSTAYPVQGFRTTFLGPNGILPRLLRETDSEVLLLTVPDVASISVLRPLGEKVGDLPYRVTLPDGSDVTAMVENWVLPDAVDGPGQDGRTSFPPGSKVSMGVVLNRFIQQGLRTPEQLRAALDATSARGFREDEVLDAQELATISGRIQEYNQVIAEGAALDRRIHLVDMHREFNAMLGGRELRGEGPPVTLGGYFTGAVDGHGREGLFSYDGVHPSDTGHAVIANILLDKVREELAWHPRFQPFVRAQPIDEKAVLANDPHHTGDAIQVSPSSRRSSNSS
ncbi:MAG: SGNH/GDSL hydrolase family protein [Candidatus Eremiobacterota bacterium]